jgi:hypothetical protein
MEMMTLTMMLVAAAAVKEGEVTEVTKQRTWTMMMTFARLKAMQNRITKWMRMTTKGTLKTPMTGMKQM